MTPFTFWLGQHWWGIPLAMLIDFYCTKAGREILRAGKARRRK